MDVPAQGDNRQRQRVPAPIVRAAPSTRGRPSARPPSRRHHENTGRRVAPAGRSEEHTSELQSLMRISYAVFCLKKKNKKIQHNYQSEQLITIVPIQTQYTTMLIYTITLSHKQPPQS